MEFVGDMSSQDFCTFVVKTTVERFGRVDFLVNNAFSFNATGMDSTRADWEKVMSVGPLAYAGAVTSLDLMVTEPPPSWVAPEAELEGGSGMGNAELELKLTQKYKLHGLPGHVPW